MFDSFEELYPQVRIIQIGQGGYAGLKESVLEAIANGTTPTMTFGYSEDFLKYVSESALIPLSGYIKHPEHGVDLDDFVSGFMRENSQYSDGLIYSMPFAKSTEMLVYNRTVFDHHGITFDHTTPIT